MNKINVSIIGVSGYTGIELLRILEKHPNVNLVDLVGNSNADKDLKEIYSHFSGVNLPKIISIEKADFTKVDVVFCCLPHATSQAVIKNLPEHLKVIDLSADFRLEDEGKYKFWYKNDHQALDLQEKAVYGLTEIYRDKIKQAELVACPGCYPTSILLPLIPLLKEKLINSDIIIDSKTGITGAGRFAKTQNLFAEINENIKPYGVSGHRHLAEIAQELEKANGKNIDLIFTPQVMAVNRGILSTIYVEPKKDLEFLKTTLEDFYKDEKFVQILADEQIPTVRDVYATNKAIINILPTYNKKRAIIISAIDNLQKGASGQAVQNFNLMFDLPEGEGLQDISIFP